MEKQTELDRLADRWYDRREIVNLAGKFVTSILLKRESEIFDRFWTKQGDACLSFNDGSYQGSAAVENYFRTMAENTAVMSQLLKEMFPEELGNKSDEELYGVGQLRGLPITTPVIELAEDGETAKGIWHIQGSDNGLTEYGPLSYWTLGFLAIDFRREDGQWKLWHVFHGEDVVAPMGESWLKPKERTPLPEYAAVAQLKKPPYNVVRVNHVPYSAQRPFTAPPRLPEPYVTFAETFSYGV